MDGIELLKQQLRNLQRKLANKKAEKQKYLDIARNIGDIYNRMAADKAVMKTYRDSVKTFSNEKIDTFSGDLYKTQYKQGMTDLVSDYNTVISNFDTNMDRLNTVRSQYESKAYECGGIIGALQSQINTIVRQIQNWVN